MHVDLTDPTLFGNDNAEDEDIAVLESYFFQRPEFLHLLEHRHAISIVRAYKGEGKSALLRMLRLKLAHDAQSGRLILVDTPATTLAPTLDSTDPVQWFQAWTAVLSRRIVAEVGATIGFAATDDASLFVEEAINQGHAARDFVSYVAHRLKVKNVPIEEHRPALRNPEALLRRWQRNAPPIWVLLDDADFNYEDKERDKCRVGQLFSAARALANSIRGIKFRLSIRPNVWTSIRLRFEDLNKLEQYVRTISWEVDDIRGLLASRIRGYIHRNHGNDGSARFSEDQLVSLAFESPMAWGEPKPPHIPLATMSWHRPRWLVELCKDGATRATRNGHDKIMLRDLENALDELGTRRFADTAAEFRVRCPQVTHLMDAFADGPFHFTTEELLQFASKSLTPIAPNIDGSKITDPMQICSFLYEIGFLTARYDYKNDKYDHVRYADRPTLLASRGNADQGHSWEIHLVFRKRLRLRARGVRR
jgi:hypothetical protein